MPIWEHSAEQVVKQLDCRQFHFLTWPTAELCLAVLIELYRCRQQESLHEVPFDAIYERVNVQIGGAPRKESFDPGVLRRALNQLVEYDNVAMRLEPRRVRSISDRGLNLLLVRLTERTNAILRHLESQLEELQQEKTSSARFSLLEVDDALGAVIALLDAAASLTQDDGCRAARELFRARRAVEEAGDDLLARDLWLSETAVQTPDRRRLAELLNHLETYFERYLYDVDQRRSQCFDRLERLLTNDANPFLDAVQDATSREYAEDPTRSGRNPPDIRLILRLIREFLRPGGLLDDRRLVVHQRLADVAGHLKRHLAELVRRSQLVATLRSITRRILLAPDDGATATELESFFLRLWQPAQAVHDESAGVPSERAVPPRPYLHRPGERRRYAGAIIRPSDQGRSTTERPTLIQRMMDLNDFVIRVVLRGNKEAVVSDARLENVGHARLLIAAVRTARLEKSQLRQRYLRYFVTIPTVEKEVVITTGDGVGRLRMPQLIFSTEPQNGHRRPLPSRADHSETSERLKIHVHGDSTNGD